MHRYTSSEPTRWQSWLKHRKTHEELGKTLASAAAGILVATESQSSGTIGDHPLTLRATIHELIQDVFGMLSSITHRDEPSTDASLLRRACEGYEEGWQRLVHIYGPLVYGWIRKCGVQSADAADVMQETLLAMATALPKFDSAQDQSCFRGWLWTIARNKLRDRQRRQSSLPREMEEIEGIDRRSMELQDEPPTDAKADSRLVRFRTLQCLQDLFPEKAWQMFWRTEIDGNDAASVAEEFGVSKWAVYKAKARILQRLRSELDGLE